MARIPDGTSGLPAGSGRPVVAVAAARAGLSRIYQLNRPFAHGGREQSVIEKNSTMKGWTALADPGG
jgi:hypothetical protein